MYLLHGTGGSEVCVYAYMYMYMYTYMICQLFAQSTCIVEYFVYMVCMCWTYSCVLACMCNFIPLALLLYAFSVSSPDEKDTDVSN